MPWETFFQRDLPDERVTHALVIGVGEYTNQLFGEMTESLQTFLAPDPDLAKQGEPVLADLEAAKRAKAVLARWRREGALQSCNGVTYTWLSRDQKALKESRRPASSAPATPPWCWTACSKAGASPSVEAPTRPSPRRRSARRPATSG